jgi:hypothetical protein
MVSLMKISRLVFEASEGGRVMICLTVPESQ